MLTAEEAREITDLNYKRVVYAEIDKVLEKIKENAKMGLYELTLYGELYKETISILEELKYKIKIRDRFHCYSKTIISWKRSKKNA